MVEDPLADIKLHERDLGWTRLANCAGAPMERFFPEGSRSEVRQLEQATIREFCHACPVRNACLEEALALPPRDDSGVWGATVVEDRNRMRRERRARQAVRSAG